MRPRPSIIGKAFALAALLSCPSREAATFIDAARARTSSIDAEVRAVQTELRRMF